MKQFFVEGNMPLFVDGISIIPEDCEILIFHDDDFNQPLMVDGKTALPDTLIIIDFGNKFNQPLIEIIDGKIIRALPINLRRIIFGSDFNQPLVVDTLEGQIGNLEKGKIPEIQG